MTTAIVFSRDRPAQLDLLLRSIAVNAGGVIDNVQLLWAAGRNTFEKAYDVCREEWPQIRWHIMNQRLDYGVIRILRAMAADDHAMFLTDDSVFYRPWDGPHPADLLDEDPHVLCFSHRLGVNTTECYPLRRPQALPRFVEQDGYLVWEWRNADADFGYPASLDGHLFRRDDLLWFLHRTHEKDPARKWVTPNQLEDAFVSKIGLAQRELMACYERSTLVGVPVNRSNGETHQTNRVGETHVRDLLALNDAYLAGGRLVLDAVRPELVNAAHVEFALEFA